MTRIPLLIAFLLVATGLLGCSEGLVNPDTADEDTQQPAEVLSKLRHGHLIEAGAAHKGGGKGGKTDGGSGGDASSTASGDGFIVGTIPLDPYAILDRYSNDFGIEPRRLFSKNRVRGFSFNTKSLTSSEKTALFAALNADPDVAYYEPEARAFTGKSSALRYRSGEQFVPSNLRDIGADVSSIAVGAGTANVPVDVYIIDSGVSHPDLNVVERIDFTDLGGEQLTPSRVLERYALLQRYALLERFEYHTGLGKDPLGHGTHVAGTLAALDDADHLVGVAPGALIHDFRVLDDNGNGDFAAVIEALQVIISRKMANPQTPMVVNLSLGANVGTAGYNALDEMVLQTIAEGISVVVAAGNEATDVSNISPAHVAAAFTVGAAENPGSGTWGVIESSNRGKGIDIWAPGNNIESLFPDDTNYMNRMTGTSMAAPHVSGAIAIYLMSNPLATLGEVEQHLKSISGTTLQRAPDKRTTDIVLDISDL